MHMDTASKFTSEFYWWKLHRSVDRPLRQQSTGIRLVDEWSLWSRSQQIVVQINANASSLSLACWRSAAQIIVSETIPRRRSSGKITRPDCFRQRRFSSASQRLQDEQGRAARRPRNFPESLPPRRTLLSAGRSVLGAPW